MFATPLRAFCVLIWALVIVFAMVLAVDGTQNYHLNRLPMDSDQQESALLVALGREKPEVSIGATLPGGAAPMPAGPAVEATEAAKIVIWINISGFRTDYVQKAASSFFTELPEKSLWTKHLMPAAPSLKWPNLVTQITGTPRSLHGVVADILIDPRTGEKADHPTALELLKAEPIWTTAKRQGLRVLVHDWPFSQSQPAKYPADYSLPEVDPKLKDADRLNRLFETWDKDAEKTKLRLLMTSLSGLEQASLQHGCRAEPTIQAVRDLDAALQTFFGKVSERLSRDLYRNDTVYAFLTTDRGMSDVTKLVNFAQLTPEFQSQLKYVLNESVAQVWFTGDDAAKAATGTAFDKKVTGQIFWENFTPDKFAPEWGLTTQPPDRVLQLKPDYAFTEAKGSEPVFPATEASGPFAASGYSVEATSRMRGQAYFFRLPKPAAAEELQEVDPSRLHATVCSILDIKPSPDAAPEPAFQFKEPSATGATTE